MLKQVFIFAVLMAALSCAMMQSKERRKSYGKNKELVPRIANGTTARQGRHPWTMAILWRDMGVCSSVLITTETALTAAHCLDMNLIDEYNGRIGDIRLRHAEIVYFSDAIIHEDFNGTYELNDIGLLILQERVQLSDRIKTIALPRTHSTYFGKADVAGWGSCSNDSSVWSDKLQVVKLNIMDPVECRDLFVTPLKRLVFICTHAQNKGPCWGDSGASLVYGRGLERRSIGIFLGDSPEKKVGECPVFTGTGYYADWIKEHAVGEITFIP